MKIFYILGGNALYGAENVSIDLIVGLQRAGHHVFCAVTTSMRAEESPVVQKLTQLGIPCTNVYLGILYFSKILWTADTLVHLPGARRKMRALIKKEDPDLIITPHYRVIPMVGSIVKKYPVVYNVQDIHAPDASHRFYFRWADKYISLYAACSSAAMKSLQVFNIPENKCVVLYNSIDVKKMPALPQGKKISEKTSIGIIGQIIHRKGHDLLIEAINRLIRKQLPVRVLVFGNGDESYINSLKEKINGYNIGSLFSFEGFTTDKAKMYSNLDIVAVPSRNEAFGLVAVEPSFYGIPVVVSSIDGLAEVVEDGCTGLLFEKDNAEDLAMKLEQLVNDKSLRQQLGEKARERVLSNFTNDSMASRLVMLAKTYLQIEN